MSPKEPKCERFECCPHESAIIRLEARTENIETKVEQVLLSQQKLTDVITGGVEGTSPGIHMQMANLKQDVETLKRAKKTERKMKDMLVASLASGALGAIGTWVVYKLGFKIEE